MGDYTELKRLADRVLMSRRFCGDENHKALADGVLALIAENERLRVDLKSVVRLNNENADLFKAKNDQLKAENERLQESHEQVCTNYNQVSYASEERGRQIDQLRAEVQRLTMAVGIQTVRSFAGQTDQKSIDELLAAGIQVDKEEIARLRAEVAGLKTGYEAYERVNAELKAECEALRDDLEQKQYDANAWRNSEESVWVEVFNSEGDDPFISAITGQITVEQLALIQAEILEYREDYFEKGSGLYVFRCAHYQAHHDNVGMTEPAHWETDLESYSPFPWEEEDASLGQGEQS